MTAAETRTYCRLASRFGSQSLAAVTLTVLIGSPLEGPKTLKALRMTHLARAPCIGFDVRAAVPYAARSVTAPLTAGHACAGKE